MLEVPDGRVIASGLSMPHSPRLYRGRLWLHNSGTGQFGSIDPGGGRFEPLTFCPGYLRGLAFVGDYAVVGLSHPRHDKTFSGLALEDELARRGAEARCGLLIIDLRTGDVAHWLRVEGLVRELYDVAVLPEVSRPMALGFKTDEIQRTIAVGEPRYSFLIPGSGGPIVGAFSEKGAHSPRWISALISGGLPEILVWPGPSSGSPVQLRRWRSRMLRLDLALGRPSGKPSMAEACAMRDSNRRGFLATSAAAAAVPLLPDLGFLAQVSRAAATDTRIDPNQVRHSPSIGQLIKLIQTTPRDKCVPVFIEQLQAGLSYQDLLSALLLATIEHGDPHQVLGVYSAHRVSSESRIEERLLPLFWALDRIVSGFQGGDASLSEGSPEICRRPARRGQSSGKPWPSWTRRGRSVRLSCSDVPRAIGGRCPFSGNVAPGEFAGSLGHHPIMVANTWRTLEALGWQHAEQVLRYLARALSRHKADSTYEPNQERAAKPWPSFRPIGPPRSLNVAPRSRCSISCDRERPMPCATSSARNFAPDA